MSGALCSDSERTNDECSIVDLCVDTPPPKRTKLRQVRLPSFVTD